MFCQAGVDPWRTTIRQPLAQLRKPQATVLALWSFGMVLARSCALSAVSPWLARGMPRKEQTVRQQRRAWQDAVPRKRGPKRHAVQIETCFPVLLAWGVSWWPGTPLALALEAPALGPRFVVLAVSVVQRGGAMPVAWVGLPATTTTHAWRRLGRRRRPTLPHGEQGLVVTERGLQAPWLFWRLGRLGQHPFLRINTGGTLRPAGTPCCRPLQRFGPQPGTRWRGRGTASQQAGGQVEGTRLALGAEGDTAPGLRLTALPPEARDACWYGLRASIAQGCTITQRAGWPGHRTRMRAPERAARRWLAVAGATLWLLRVGGMAEDDMPESTLRAVTALCPERPRTRRATRLRLVSVLRQGGVARLVALRRHAPLPPGAFVPEPWPTVPPWEDEARAPERALPQAACGVGGGPGVGAGATTRPINA